MSRERKIILWETQRFTMVFIFYRYAINVWSLTWSWALLLSRNKCLRKGQLTEELKSHHRVQIKAGVSHSCPIWFISVDLTDANDNDRFRFPKLAPPDLIAWEICCLPGHPSIGIWNPEQSKDLNSSTWKQDLQASEAASLLSGEKLVSNLFSPWLRGICIWKGT